MTKNIYSDGMLGLIVGDALGVPVEFSCRDEREADPITGMRAFGTHNQPMGTWSDDSSMALASLDSIIKTNGIDYADMMSRFSDWCLHGDYTPFQEVFDIGITTSRAIMNFSRQMSPVECGMKSAHENGNGSLMRILPVCLYLYNRQKRVCTSEDEAIYIIHNVSCLTHAHMRSQMGCGLYYFLVKGILDGSGTLARKLQQGIDMGMSFYRRDFANYAELNYYGRLTDLERFAALPSDEIRSSGYVVDTLEAAVWCLLNTSSYEDAVLTAVNLGDDTDTVGAVTGGLAGLYYGADHIPEEWLKVLQKKAWIEELLEVAADIR